MGRRVPAPNDGSKDNTGLALWSDPLNWENGSIPNETGDKVVIDLTSRTSTYHFENDIPNVVLSTISIKTKNNVLFGRNFAENAITVTESVDLEITGPGYFAFNQKFAGDAVSFFSHGDGDGSLDWWRTCPDLNGDFVLSNRYTAVKTTTPFGSSPDSHVTVYVRAKNRTQGCRFENQNPTAFPMPFRFVQLPLVAGDTGSDQTRNPQSMGTFCQNVIFDGKVTVEPWREFRFYGTKTVFNGGIEVLSSHCPNLRPTILFQTPEAYLNEQTLVIHDASFYSDSGKTYYSDSGKTYLGVPVTAGGISYGNLVFQEGRDDLLAHAGTMTLGFSYARPASAWVDLNGTFQRVQGVGVSVSNDEKNDTTHPNIRITATKPGGVLEIFGSGDQVYTGRVIGEASLLKSGPGTMTIKSVGNTTTGGLSVTNGTLVLDVTAEFTSLSSLTAAKTGSLVVKTPNMGNVLESVTVSDDGTLTLDEGVHLTVKRLTVGGTPLGRGVYAPPDVGAGVSGSGMIEVTEDLVPAAGTTFVWTGAGADTHLSTAANWTGGVAPSLVDGDETLSFPVGTEALVDTDAVVRALDFSGEQNNFVLRGAEGKRLKVFCGISVTRDAADETRREYRIDSDIELAAVDQEWAIASNQILHVTGVISGGSTGHTITTTDFGVLKLSGENRNWLSSLTSLKGNVHVTSSWGLGPGGTREVKIQAYPSTAQNRGGNYLLFSPNEFRLGAAAVGTVITNFANVTWSGQPNLLISSSSTLVSLGRFRRIPTVSGMSPVNGETLFRATNGMVVFAGGLETSLYPDGSQVLTLLWGGSGTVRVTGVPLDLRVGDKIGRLHFCESAASHSLAVSSNVVAELNVRNGHFRVQAPDVFAVEHAPPFILGAQYVGNGNGTFWLEHDLNVRCLYSNFNTGAYPNARHVIESANGGVLRIQGPYTGAALTQNQVMFTGSVGLDMCGLNGVCTNHLDRHQSDSTGPLTVSGGTFVFRKNAGWVGSSNVTISAKGAIRVLNEDSNMAFCPDGDVSRCRVTLRAAPEWSKSLSDEEKSAIAPTLEIPAGQRETVRRFEYQGRGMQAGLYAGDDYAGGETVRRLPFITGGGVLRVMESSVPGVYLVLR